LTAAGTPVAIVCATDARGRVLLVLQNSGMYEGDWLFPGGIVDEGESAEQAARRELSEETGMRAGTLDRVGSYDVIAPTVRFRVHIYRTTDLEGEPRAEKGSDVRWFDPSDQRLRAGIRYQLREAGVLDEPLEGIMRELARDSIRIEKIS
jgi:8-oxo-dGTP pyrophosphatase MutT (NUDIX family)